MAAILEATDCEARVDSDRFATFAPAFLIPWTCFLFLYGLDSGELWRNEGLRARIAQEMLASGGWIVPTLYEQPIFTKPPFLYWAICLFSWPFGEVTTATARLPSVAAGLGTVLLFLWYFRRCLGTRAGYLAALFVPLSIFWLEKVPSAEIDGVQVFWVVGSTLFFLRWMERGDGTWWFWTALCLAGGTLTKWTAPAFLYGTVVPLLWWRRELKLLLGWRHLLMLTVAVGLVGAWIGAAIWQTSPELFWDAIVAEAAPRLLPAENPKPYPWLETLVHPLVVVAAALPLSLGILIPQARRLACGLELNGLNGERGRRLFQALHCWLWPNLLFWTLHPDHTLRNRAPLFPAIAGLAVFAWLAWERRAGGETRWFRQPRRWLVGFLIVWMGLKCFHVEGTMRLRAQQRRVREKAALLAGWLPAGATLVLFRLKDECLFFYLNRPVRRLAALDYVPNTGEAVYCILTEEEWMEWRGRYRLVGQTEDGQGDGIFLVDAIPGNAVLIPGLE